MVIYAGPATIRLAARLLVVAVCLHGTAGCGSDTPGGPRNATGMTMTSKQIPTTQWTPTRAESESVPPAAQNVAVATLLYQPDGKDFDSTPASVRDAGWAWAFVFNYEGKRFVRDGQVHTEHQSPDTLRIDVRKGDLAAFLVPSR